MLHLNRRLAYVTAGLAAVAILVSGSAVSYAQEKKPAAGTAKPAASKADAGKPRSAWVKLCHKGPVAVPSADPEKKPPEKNICVTQSEQLDQRTGLTRVSAGIREIEGADNRSLMVMVPLGMAIPPGVGVVVLSKEQWQKIAKKEKFDEKQLKSIRLGYSLCYEAGCSAEKVVDDKFLTSMKKGGVLMVLPMNAGAKQIPFAIPLAGFTDTYAGKPADMKEYAKVRRQLIAQIRKRQEDAAKALKEIEKVKKPGEDAAKPKKK